MRVLVIGGTGLIGSYAAMALKDAGHEVSVAARRPPRADSPIARFNFVTCDFLKGPPSIEVLSQFEGIVFATGVDWRVQPTSDPFLFFEQANARAPAEVFRQAGRAGITRGVLVTSYYHVIKPELRRQPYVKSRFESEQAVFDASGPGMNVCAIAPSWVMGPTVGIDTSFGETVTKLVNSRRPLFSIAGGTNWVSARSLGIAVCRALEDGRDRARYLVGDENRSWADVVRQFAALAGRADSNLLVLPPRVVSGLGWAMSLKRRARGKSTGWSESSFTRTIAGDCYFEECSGQELGYPTGQIDQAIGETYTMCTARLAGRAGPRPSPMGDARDAHDGNHLNAQDTSWRAHT